MKALRSGSKIIAAAFLLAGTSAFGQFLGYLSGYYAPAKWTTFVSGNPLHQTTAFVYTGNAPQSVEITRAASSASGRARSQILISSAYLLRQLVTHGNKVAAIESSKER